MATDTTTEDIKSIMTGKSDDKLEDLELEGIVAGGGDEAGGAAAGGEEAGGEEGGGLFAADIPQGIELLTAVPGSGTADDTEEDDDDDIDIDSLTMSIKDPDAPMKAQNQIRSITNKPIIKNRRVTAGPNSTHMPDFMNMTGVGRTGRKQDTLNKPYDDDFVNNPFKEGVLQDVNAPFDDFLDNKLNQHVKMTREIRDVLTNMERKISIDSAAVLVEDGNTSEEIDIEIV